MSEIVPTNPIPGMTYADEEYEINPDEFLSMGRSTPFKGEKVFAKCKMTFADGKLAWKE